MTLLTIPRTIIFGFFVVVLLTAMPSSSSQTIELQLRHDGEAQPHYNTIAAALFQLSKTRLESRTYSGGDLDSSFPWVRNVTITSGTLLYFRWRTTEQDVTSAEWQVTDSSGGFTGQPNIIASGERTDGPAAGQMSQFAIDFKQLLPQSPPTQPKHYYVRIVPRKGRLNLVPSAAVMITYTQPEPQTELREFLSLDRFEQNLKARLEGKATGYAYAIYQNELLKRAGSGGVAVWPNVPHSPDRRTTMLSMSKTVTAAAVMKAMEEMRAKGRTITIDSLIAQYLPSNWALGPHVSEMTFKHLLTHKSGLRMAQNGDPKSTDADTYLNLRQTIATGATDENFGRREYANANFCLFRIIIPYMVSDRAALETFELNTDFIARHTGVTYVTYVSKHILQPIGLNGVSVVPTGPVPYTRYYKFNFHLVYFTDPLDDTAVLRTGAGYWHMSVKEFGKFISALRQGDKIISAESFKLMTDNQLGMYAQDSDHGRYWNHNGGSPDVYGGAGTMSDWMIFPDGVTAVITVNSRGGISEAPQDLVRNAFNGSWSALN